MCNFSNRIVNFFLLIFLTKNSALCDTGGEEFFEVLDNSASITVSLRNYSVSNQDGESVDSLHILPPYSVSEIIVTDIPDNVHFVVVQVHSYLADVILSLDDNPNQSNSITGTNVGLLKIYRKTNLSFYLTYNNTAEEANIMVSVQAYTENAPIPGGCNMEFQVEISPFLLTTYDDIKTEVNFAPSAPPSSVLSQFLLPPSNECNIKPSPVQHRMYYLYLPERDFSRETYFSALKSMMTKGRILENGVLAPNKLSTSPLKKLFATYPGTGRVFVVVSYFGNYSAVYVPSFTYGCNDLMINNTCDVLTTTFSKVLCASILFMGLFVCFFGHFFFRLEIFLFGFLASGIITYIVTAILFSETFALSASVSVGLLSAGGILIAVTCLGLPLIPLVLATLPLGFLISSIIFYPITDHADFFVLDVNYWGVFIGITTTFPIIMLCLAEKANILACACAGSFLAVTSIDHYLGSNLRYSAINVIRRAIDPKFRYAITSPPFQLNDSAVTILWLILKLIGRAIQKRLTKNKPPFPPPENYFQIWGNSSRNRRNRTSETTPLISERYAPARYFSNYYYGN